MDTPYDSPVRVRYGVFFVSAKSELCLTFVSDEVYVILDRDISRVDCIITLVVEHNDGDGFFLFSWK